MAIKAKTITTNEQLEKAPTGIAGLDSVTHGGLPRGRPTLVCGEAGSGKTLLAMEFLLRGASEFGEPGVFVSFEERPHELVQNVPSQGPDAAALVSEGKIAFEHVHIERSEIQETGDYDLEALFIRLGAVVDSVNATRIAFDTLEVLFSNLDNEGVLRGELRRLFRWVKDRGLTAVITGERGERTLTRHGLEEYVSDCVIVLDHPVVSNVATRRLRVAKYRGSAHQTGEVPFIIDERGFSVLPITALGLDYAVSDELFRSGVDRLDVMLGGGLYRGSSILISGTAGTGKSALCSSFVEAACRRGERALYVSFEESQQQMARNMRSLGIDLGTWVEKGLLQFSARRPTLYGLELHLVTIEMAILEHQPTLVVLDPVTGFLHAGGFNEASMMLLRLVDIAKQRGITTIFSSLSAASDEADESQVGISSVMDSWISIRSMETNGERTRTLYVIKSRGAAHSNQVREYVLSDRGIDLIDVYTGSGSVLTGTARIAQEALERAEAQSRQDALARHQRQLEIERRTLESEIAKLRARFADREHELEDLVEKERRLVGVGGEAKNAMAASRRADGGSRQPGGVT